MTDRNLMAGVVLSINCGLLGVIPPNLRGVTCAWDESRIEFHCYFDGEIPEYDRESMECVATEVIAAFPEHEVLMKCIRHDSPEPLIPLMLDVWVYRRKEVGS